METKEDRGTTSEGNCYNGVEETLDSTKEKQFEELKGEYPNAFSRNIMTKLDKVPQKNRKSYIYRVDDSLRVGNEKHYEPLLFSIGPYNRGKSKLQHMEKYKWQSLNRLMEQIMDNRGISRSDQINIYYEVLKGLEGDARAYYEEFISMEEDEFLEMLLLDGCFLIETLLNGHDFSLHNMDWVVDVRGHDLLLLENQLPFFVLKKLCETMTSPEEYDPFMLYTRAVTWVPKDKYITPSHIDPEKLKNTKHLLDLAYKVLFQEDLLVVTAATIPISVLHYDKQFLDDLFNTPYFKTYSVTELSNAGVKFKPVAHKRFYDIKFKNGTLEIPVISIQRDQTEGLLRNLIAYERCSNKTRTVCDYIRFMDSLINSGKDVELLRIYGIIHHYLGNDEAVSTMFNKIGTITEMSVPLYYYSDIVKSLEDHCRKRTNIWMAKLRSDYFSNPWAIISVIAAFVLLVLTVIQTVYTLISYYNG